MNHQSRNKSYLVAAALCIWSTFGVACSAADEWSEEGDLAEEQLGEDQSALAEPPQTQISTNANGNSGCLTIDPNNHSRVYFGTCAKAGTDPYQNWDFPAHNLPKDGRSFYLLNKKTARYLKWEDFSIKTVVLPWGQPATLPPAQRNHFTFHFDHFARQFSGALNFGRPAVYIARGHYGYKSNCGLGAKGRHLLIQTGSSLKVWNDCKSSNPAGNGMFNIDSPGRKNPIWGN